MFTLKKLMFIFGLKSVTKVDSALPGGVQRHLWPWSNTHVFRNLRSRGIFSTHWNVDFYKICWPLELNNALEESIALQRASLFCLLSKKIAEMRGIVGMICIHKKTLICSHFNYKRSLAKGRRKIYKKIGLGADRKFCSPLSSSSLRAGIVIVSWRQPEVRSLNRVEAFFNPETSC